MPSTSEPSLRPEPLFAGIANCSAHARRQFRGGRIVQATEYIPWAADYRWTAEVRREFFKAPYPTAAGAVVAGLLRRHRDLRGRCSARLTVRRLDSERSELKVSPIDLSQRTRSRVA
jgi:hypothetical protein